jgi:hypothetical protein
VFPIHTPSILHTALVVLVQCGLHHEWKGYYEVNVDDPNGVKVRFHLGKPSLKGKVM